jgi:hypothetical protein
MSILPSSRTAVHAAPPAHLDHLFNAAGESAEAVINDLAQPFSRRSTFRVERFLGEWRTFLAAVASAAPVWQTGAEVYHYLRERARRESPRFDANPLTVDEHFAVRHSRAVTAPELLMVRCCSCLSGVEFVEVDGLAPTGECCGRRYTAHALVYALEVEEVRS